MATKQPARPAPVPPFEFRPMQGCLSILGRGAAALGLGNYWYGQNGLGEIIREAVLKPAGIPDQPIALTDQSGRVSPRAVAEVLGVVKKKKRVKRCTA